MRIPRVGEAALIDLIARTLEIPKPLLDAALLRELRGP
jgi:hypothetical protein